MIQIRTVTAFVDPGFPLSTAVMQEAANALGAVRRGLEDCGDVVQTTRLALPPFGRLVGDEATAKVVALARQLQDSCGALGIDYATIGPAMPADHPACFSAIPDAIAATDRVFASAILNVGDGIALAAVGQAAAVVHRCARISPDGFGNLRFAALANVPPGVPFLPAAYHDGSRPSLAIGVEAAPLAVAAVAGAASPHEARARLIAVVEKEAERLLAVAEAHAGHFAVAGLDFSLAPFPETARSLGTAIERLSGVGLGGPSTLASVAFLASSLDGAQFRRSGYSGIFLPVFEDAVLAARAAEGRLTVNDLLLYSSVCGTGLDTVPLPGDARPSDLAAVLLDVAALAVRLDKPLTARLMPIPGARAGDEVRFDFPYFAPTRVFALDGPEPSRSLLAGEPGVLEIRPRHP